MKRIWKYELTTNGVILGLEGKFNRLLDIQKQNGKICAWIEVDDDAEMIELELVGIGTGWDYPETMKGFKYFQTVQDGDYVWHYFWRVS